MLYDAITKYGNIAMLMKIMQLLIIHTWNTIVISYIKFKSEIIQYSFSSTYACIASIWLVYITSDCPSHANSKI